MFSPVIDWDDIRTGVVDQLGHENVGWVRIVTNCLEDVKTYADDNNIACPEIWKIKERFAELRICYDCEGADDHQNDLIEAAVKLANASCQRCGNACHRQSWHAWAVKMCCWCLHRIAEERGERLSLNRLDEGHPLQCKFCGYLGQIAWTASGKRCPACVSRGLS